MNLDSLLKDLRDKFDVFVFFEFPVLYLMIEPGSIDLNFSDEEEFVSQSLSVEYGALVEVLDKSSAQLFVKGISEDYDDVLKVVSDSESSHWLAVSSMASNDRINKKCQLSANDCRAIHFYGYKGGQARSTVMGVLAKSLADDGYKVLVVDVDFEAPSLPSMFDTYVDDPSSTVYGICQLGLDIKPKRIYEPASYDGGVDIIAACPSTDDHAIGYAAFLLKTMMYHGDLKRFVSDLKNKTSSDYDVVLFDHRTGFSSSLLPIVNTWPGSSVIMSRLDSYDSVDKKINAHLFSLYPKDPGAYVSFSMDPESSDSLIRSGSGAKIDFLLDPLGEAIEMGAEQSDGESIGYEALSEYWVNWFYDRAFLYKAVPDVDEISVDNKYAIENLRAAVSLSNAKLSEPPASVFSSISGATDEGLFIQTEEISKVFNSDSNMSYVLGRKGTGKTRLANELLARKRAFPILLTNDSDFLGIRSNTSDFEFLENHFNKDYYSLWWGLLYIAIELGHNRKDKADVLSRLVEKPRDFFTSYGMSSYLKSDVDSVLQFTIDGVETATSPKQLTSFVESLLKFMSTVQADDEIKSKIKIKLFIRNDLVEGSIENIEQQMNGRTITLSWDQDSIFNFLLSRIYQHEWFRDKFPKACEKIEDESNLIVKGKATQEFYLDVINDIFPSKLRRNNIQTFTFLKSYFSDSGIDAEKRTTYYPRLYIYFLNNLLDLVSNDASGGMENNRLRHDIVLDAHQKATIEFMTDVRKELSSFISIVDDRVENERAVNFLLDSFEGRQTPFDINETVKEVSADISYNEQVILSAIKDMAKFGIFEQTPKNPRSLRAGQMYKTALKMKYVRKKTA